MSKALDTALILVLITLAFAWFLVWPTIGMLWTFGWI